MTSEQGKLTRSDIMRSVGRRDTKPEMRVRRVAHRLGLRFRLYVRKLPGSPDLVFPKHRVVIFVHGCFWHRHPGCNRASSPKTRAQFWQDKFAANVERDRRTSAALAALGWRTAVIWECTTGSDESVEQQLRSIFGMSSN
ncbi:very short patch repair endonuclease [Paraburkholderia tropica]|uniref:very short patch repair endonuclease n=1 Tax=Paraburkholderia tropica TaxID=92647 RepID=UPI002AB0C61B|nr:very short patch repair endonuclease [Paraburkholderia tropica]